VACKYVSLSWFIVSLLALQQGASAQPAPTQGTRGILAPRSTAAEATAEPSAPPVPRNVRFDVWFARLLEVLDTIPAPTVEREFAEFAAGRGLDVNDALLRRDFRRVRLLFEATRDGGFWHLRWDITNEKPSSRSIWQQWRDKPVEGNFGVASATAECDELSALLGMLSKHAGVTNVGLFYPTWNHTIAVWAPLSGKNRTPLVQLPTSQIFLGCDAGFDRTTFQTTRTNIQAYPAFDLRPYSLLPAARGEWMLEQVKRYAAGSAELWSLLRAHRAYVLGSSMGTCNQQRAEWALALEHALSAEDERILVTVGTEEIGMHAPTAKQVLAWLAIQYAVAPR
jgi:hypothetical protein